MGIDRGVHCMSKVFYEDEQVTLCHGDCLDVLASLPDASVDSVVTDPPYGLDFMGKHWDTGSVAFDTVVWAHCLRILKPGGHLLAFGGTRTWHRLVCAVEDAGFEIRDNIAWLYGSGFPKSLNVSKAIDKAAGAEREVLSATERGTRLVPGGDAARTGQAWHSDERPVYVQEVTAPATDDAKLWAGWGTALKPAFEPVVVARKPLGGTVAANVLAHGVGALNIDGCRVGTDERTNRGMSSLGVMHDDDWKPRDVSNTVTGRWPSNVVLDECAAQEIDRQSGVSVSRATVGNRPGKTAGTYGAFVGQESVSMGHNDEGGASRFFPIFRYQAKAPKKERPVVDGNAHPTVKPLELMRWLVRLVTPPGGYVLDPFAGSGTTGEAALIEGFRCLLIESEAAYLPLIMTRLDRCRE